MDGRDLARCITGARWHPNLREGFTALWRAQRPLAGGSAEECLRAGRDPLRRLEALRRGFGRPRGARKH
jgi:hypothetical protein